MVIIVDLSPPSVEPLGSILSTQLQALECGYRAGLVDILNSGEFGKSSMSESKRFIKIVLIVTK